MPSIGTASARAALTFLSNRYRPWFCQLRAIKAKPRHFNLRVAVGDEQKALLAFTQHFAKLVRPPAGKQIDNQCSNIAEAVLRAFRAHVPLYFADNAQKVRQ